MINALDTVKTVVMASSASIGELLNVTEDEIIRTLEGSNTQEDMYFSEQEGIKSLGVTLDGFLYVVMTTNNPKANELKKQIIESLRFIGNELMIRQKSSKLVSEIYEELLGEAKIDMKVTEVEYKFAKYNKFVYEHLMGKTLFDLKTEYHLTSTHYLRERFSLKLVRGLQSREGEVMKQLIRLHGLGLSEADLHSEVLVSLKITCAVK